VQDGGTGLVVGKDEGVGNNDVLPPPSGEDNCLGDICRCQRFATAMGKSVSPILKRFHMVSLASLSAHRYLRIDSISLSFVAVESHDRKLGLYLARVNVNDADSFRN